MITATSGATGSQAASITGGAGTSLGRDVFLKLLVTQLQMQDPLSPMEDKEFISQLAQFSTLEQMQSMNQNLDTFMKSQLSFAVLSLIGKSVEWIDAETGDVSKGVVDGIQFGGDSPILKVGEHDVPLSMVLRVS